MIANVSVSLSEGESHDYRSNQTLARELHGVPLAFAMSLPSVVLEILAVMIGAKPCTVIEAPSPLERIGKIMQKTYFLNIILILIVKNISLWRTRTTIIDRRRLQAWLSDIIRWYVSLLSFFCLLYLLSRTVLFIQLFLVVLINCLLYFLLLIRDRFIYFFILII